MAKISKIEAQKRKGRYNIYLDGKYAFPVAESVLIQFRLMKGTELDEKQIAAIATADQQAKAYSRMLDYLSYQMRTESDIIKKLKEIDTPEEFVEPILKKLRGQQLIDDHAYAASYVRTMINTDLKGPGVIRQHLRQKGIGENDIDDALTQFTPPATKGKYIKIKYITQLPTPTPQFAFFVNLPQYIKEPYRRFLENNIREHWDFSGVPMQIYFRQK